MVKLRSLRFRPLEKTKDNVLLEKTYGKDLQMRFGDEKDDLQSPKRYFADSGFQRGEKDATILREKTKNVVQGLTEHFIKKHHKVWQPFTYPTQLGQAFFAPLIINNQTHWFEPTPRCLKCRVLHKYNLMPQENLEGELTEFTLDSNIGRLKLLENVMVCVNDSLQCAEDICFVKLRELGRVDNVELAGFKL